MRISNRSVLAADRQNLHQLRVYKNVIGSYWPSLLLADRWPVRQR
jgi:hypothetical protein